MIKNNKFAILTYILTLIFLNGCQNFKDGLSLKKKTNTDEFLVQKKNPLVLPPDYDALPKPMSDQKVQRKKNIDDIDLSQVFSDSQNTSEKNSEINKSIEDIKKGIEYGLVSKKEMNDNNRTGQLIADIKMRNFDASAREFCSILDLAASAYKIKNTDDLIWSAITL